MAQDCDCTTPMKDLGTPNCPEKMGRPVKFALVEIKDSTGAYNKIASGATLDQAYLDAAKANLDLTKRWFITPEVKDFLSAKDDATYKTYDDGSDERIRDGKRSYTGLFKYADPVFLKFLLTARCKNMGILLITDTNVIQGYSKDTTGDVYPIPMETLDAVFNYESGDDIENVNFTLSIPILIKDAMLAAIYGATGDLTGMEGLLYYVGTPSAASATGYTFTLVGGGQFGFTDGYVGLIVADLIAYDETALSAQVITSVTATATAGVYTIVFTTPTATNTISLTPSQAFLTAGFTFVKSELAIS